MHPAMDLDALAAVRGGVADLDLGGSTALGRTSDTETQGASGNPAVAGRAARRGHAPAWRQADSGPGR